MSDKSNARFVAVSALDEINIHAICQNGNHATLCGLDGDDPHDAIQQHLVPLPKHPKIDCEMCKQIIRTAKNYRERDFK